MYKICIIGIYFGKLPNYFSLWLNSCRYNETIDFLIITDQPITDQPNNVNLINMSFDEFKELVQSKFDFKVLLKVPYKICDFKPAFGLICEEYLKEYDFWGHCDFDMIFGDLRKYFDTILTNSYDKILPLGHLSLYKNKRENNNRFKLSGSLVGDYKKVFANDKAFIFDETRGIYEIYKKNNFTIYDERIFADISEIYRRFRLALDDINYNYQIFSFCEGKIYREYFINGEYNKDEFIYIHIKKPKCLKIMCSSNNWNCFYITNTGFYEKRCRAEKEDIKRYNKFQGELYEKLEKVKYVISKLILKFLKMKKLYFKKVRSYNS